MVKCRSQFHNGSREVRAGGEQFEDDNVGRIALIGDADEYANRGSQRSYVDAQQVPVLAIDQSDGPSYPQ